MFELGKVYRRRELHDLYGGQQQGGIVTPKAHAFVMAITGDAGAAFGYDDERHPDGTWTYFGEGQSGDMQFLRGNVAIRDHASNGRDLHLFAKRRPAHVEYLGQYVCAGYDLVSGVPDVDDVPRVAIAFQLAPASPDGADSDDADLATDGLDLAGLRLIALEAVTAVAGHTEAKRKVYQRSAAVRRYVLLRAAGECEGCRSPAPFVTTAGSPYLEPHHTRRISDGGPDDPRWVIALCPTCHRRVHHASDGETYNDTLKHRLAHLEPPAS